MRIVPRRGAWLVAATIFAGCPAVAQEAPADSGVPVAVAPVIAVAPATPVSPSSPGPLFNEDRIFKVMPDYQTVTETPTNKIAPLTAKQKWLLGWKETVDPFNIASAAMAAGFSQAGNETPKYGEGGKAYAERFAAAVADFGTQNLFSAGLFAVLFHQDPRYFRKGEGARIPARIAYSVSRLFVCRNDSGRSVFNASGIFGMALGIGASNLYYPSASVHGGVMAGRLETSLFGGVLGNLQSEFWPDIEKKFFHKKQK